MASSDPLSVSVFYPKANRIGCYLGLVTLLSVVGFFAWMECTSSIDDSGSPKLAEAWRGELLSYPDIATATQANPEVQAFAFPNGEWVLGLTADSHCPIWSSGGTVVIRKGDGTVLAFFGHVCGSGILEQKYRNCPDWKTLVESIREDRRLNGLEHRFE